MFDFWVGDWQASWINSNGSRGRGRNRITKSLGGGVIEENFQEAPESSPSPLLGKSLSVLEKASSRWRQTWVDNQGRFIVLRGSQDGDKRIFTTDMTERAGKLTVQRMVFHSITKDAFVWDWEGSTDGGTSWKRA